jgi:hypothetical protein
VGALRSLRLRLVAVLTGVVVCAMGVVFLYVVPSLRQNLISDRMNRLVAVARSQQHAPGLVKAFSNGEHVRRALLHSSRIANAQVGAFTKTGGVLAPFPGATPPVLGRTSPIVRTAGSAVAAPPAARSWSRSACPAGWCSSRRASAT